MPNPLPDKLKSLLDRDVNLSDLLKGGSLSLFLKVAGVGLVYGFYFVGSRWLGPSGMGVFSFSFTLISIIAVISRLGLDTYMLKEVAALSAEGSWKKINDLYKKSVGLTTLTSIAFGFIIYLALPPALRYFEQDVFIPAVKLTAWIILPAALLGLHSEMFRGLQKVTLHNLLQNSGVLFIAGIALYFFHLESPSDLNGVKAFAIGQSVFAILAFILWARQRKAKSSEPGQGFRKILKSSIPMLVGSTSFFILMWGDKLMLGFMSGDSQLGIYEYAAKVANLNSYILIAINTIAAGKFSQMASKKDYSALKKFTQQTTTLAFIFSLPILLIILIVPEFLLSLFGENNEFVPGSGALMILACGQFLSAISGSVMTILNMAGKERIAQNTLLSASILNLLLNVWLIPLYGIEGAATATFITTIIWNGIGIIFIRKYFGFSTFNFRFRL